jgi:acyl-CoA dehydrogenase
MVFAMHQSSVACLVQHAGDSAAMARMLRMIAEKQLLVASSTTEGQAGGDLRSSAAAVEKQDAFITLDRAATVISYGAHADAILTTARRASDANKTDQVLLFVPKQNYSLTPTSGWDTLGMRGTCSQGFNLIAKGAPDMVLPASYETIHAHTMMPVSHLLWTSAWAGIAAAAVERAQRLIRKSARRAGGQTPPAASHATRAAATLRVLQATVNAGLARYERAARTPEEFETIDFQTTLNLLKVNASELAIATVMSAFQACGLSGYRNDGEFSVARQVRDILSTSIMINNDRILTNSATGALLSGVPDSLTL